MSRTVVKWQGLYLWALQELERQHGQRPFRLDFVTTYLYRHSPELQGTAFEREKARNDVREARLEKWRRQADAGDERAERLLELQIKVSSFAGERPAWRKDLPYEVNLNETRVMRLLAKRGLIEKDWQRGFVSLTDAGRAIGARSTCIGVFASIEEMLPGWEQDPVA